MGRDKALLPFGPDEVLLERVVRLVSEVVPTERIVCVAAADQSLPPLSSGVQVVRDTEPYCGPLAGLSTGFDSLAPQADAAFVCGCDTPLLMPALIDRMFDRLGNWQAIVPRAGGQIQPLVAVYRSDISTIANSLLEKGQRSLHALVERCNAQIVDPDELQDVDPELSSLVSCNTREEYERLVKVAYPS